MAAESWVLNGLLLNGGSFALMELNADPPRQRQDWIGAADSESEALVRQPLHENRKITMKLRIVQQASMDAALDKIGALVDKLRAASATPDGIDLVWTPTESSRPRTFTVLAGEITGMPIATTGEGMLWVKGQPILAVELTCKPYWLGTETVTSTASSSTPFVTLEVAGVTGDVSALGRLIVTDTATQSRRHVEWGLEGPLTYNSGTSLLIDSDNMVTSGFAGSQTTVTGAYDPNATGNQAIQLIVAGLKATTALCGTGNLSHVGTFRVKARVWSSNGPITQFRLAWRAGDGPMVTNDWAAPTVAAQWGEIDLGSITVPAAAIGSQRWTGQVEMYDSSGLSIITYVDYLILVPTSDGYGKARASYAYTPGAVVGYDNFAATTAGNALATRAAPAGGSWATSGETTDWTFQDSFITGDTIETIRRNVQTDTTTGRFAILGSTNYTDTQVDVRLRNSSSSVGPSSSKQSLIARWVDSSNYLRLTVGQETSGSASLVLERVVTGTATVLASTTWTRTPLLAYRARLITYASGLIVGQVLSDSGTALAALVASSTVTATGGTLQTGKPGLRDFGAGTDLTHSRWLTEFATSVPAAEPIALYSGRNMQIRYDDTLRQDSTGTYTGRPASYRGSRFLVPVGTSRVLVKARRNDTDTSIDDNVTDATQIQVGWTPRGIAVPR